MEIVGENPFLDKKRCFLPTAPNMLASLTHLGVIAISVLVLPCGDLWRYGLVQLLLKVDERAHFSLFGCNALAKSECTDAA